MRLIKLSTLGIIVSFLTVITAPAVMDTDFHWAFTRRSAERLFENEQYAAAHTALTAVARGAPNDLARAEVLSLAALALAHQEQYERALSDAREIEQPDYAAYTRLQILALSGKNEQIVAEFGGRDLNGWPERIKYRAFLTRGRAFQAGENITAALADFESCAASAGAHPETRLSTLNRIGALHRQLDDIEQAKHAWRRVVDLCRDNPGLSGSHHQFPRALMDLAAVLTDEQRYQEALDYLALYDLSRSKTWAANIPERRGDIYMAWQRPVEALAEYRLALESAGRRNQIRAIEAKIDAITSE